MRFNSSVCRSGREHTSEVAPATTHFQHGCQKQFVFVVFLVSGLSVCLFVCLVFNYHANISSSEYLVLVI